MATRTILCAMKERQQTVEYLQRHIPHLEVCWDTKRSLMDTFLRACEMAGDDPVLRIQDDIILTMNFVEKAQAVIDEHPDDVIQFFSRRKDDLTIGSRWLPGRTYLMNQCFYIPAGMSKELINFYWSPYWLSKCHTHPSGMEYEDDTMMADMFRIKGINYYLHVPSLVDHQKGKSMANPKRSPSRSSLTFRDPVDL